MNDEHSATVLLLNALKLLDHRDAETIDEVKRNMTTAASIIKQIELGDLNS